MNKDNMGFNLLFCGYYQGVLDTDNIVFRQESNTDNFSGGKYPHEANR